MNDREPALNPEERKIATSLAELPELPPDYIRAVHFCPPASIDGIKERGGLDYSKYGMAASMADSFSEAGVAVYSTNDRRYSSPETLCVIFDMPASEWKNHNRNGKVPGLIPLSQLVGIVPANQDKKHD